MALQTTGQISVGDIATEFGDATPNAMSEFYGAGGAPASGALSISDFYGLASFTMPSGIIIPFTGESTPSGWAAFASANDKGLIGAGSTYASGSSGGTSSFSKAVSFTSAGAHATTTSGSSGSSGTNQRGGTAGAHVHSATIATSTAHPSYKSYKLIKASSDRSSVPAGGVILGVSTITGTGVSNVDSGINRCLYGGSSVATGGSETHTMSGTTSSSGSHLHPSTFPDSGDGLSRARFGATAGAHTHVGSGTLSLNLKKIYVTAWSNASTEFSFEGAGIAMWESATPPDGWSICNGTNGTPDMRDYFVYIGSTGNHGTTAGNNTHDITSISAAGNITHNHTNLNPECPTSASRSHGNASWSHSHTASNTSVSGVTPYYALYFIQYTG